MDPIKDALSHLNGQVRAAVDTALQHQVPFVAVAGVMGRIYKDVLDLWAIAEAKQAAKANPPLYLPRNPNGGPIVEP